MIKTLLNPSTKKNVNPFVKKIIFLIAALCCLQASSLFAQPLNDNCAEAVSLTVGANASSAVSVTGDVTDATQSVVACKGSADDDVWYSFVATGTNQTIKVVPSASFDAVLQLYSGTCAALTSINCSNEFLAGKAEILPWNGLTIGETYYVRVHHFGAKKPATTTFDISVYTPAAPANDNCDFAELLTVRPTCQNITRSAEGATHSGITPTCLAASADPNDDVWFKFVAPASGKAIIRVDGSKDLRAVVEVFSGCNGTGWISCTKAASHNEIIKVSLTGLTPANTYYFRVFDFLTELPTTLTFDICVLDPPVPLNDDCGVGASPLASGSSVWNSGDLHGSTASSGPGVCSGNPDDDSWFSFIPTSDQQVVKVRPSSGFDAVAQVLDGCNGNVIACKDDSTMGDMEVFTLSGLTASNTYYLRVFSKEIGVTPTSSFEISTYSPLTNDECIGATSFTVSPAPTPVNGTVDGATRSMMACSGNAYSSEDDVWFKFNASASDNSITVKGSAGFDAAIELFDECGGTSMACKNDSAAGQDEKITPTNLVGGNTYYVRVYDANEEEASTKTFSIYGTGVLLQSTHKAVLESTLQVYPIPSSNVVNVNFIAAGSADITLKLLSTDGRIAYTNSLNKTSGEISERIDISGFTKGMYLLQIQMGEDIVSKKIVVN